MREKLLPRRWELLAFRCLGLRVGLDQNPTLIAQDQFGVCGPFRGFDSQKAVTPGLRLGCLVESWPVPSYTRGACPMQFGREKCHYFFDIVVLREALHEVGVSCALVEAVSEEISPSWVEESGDCLDLVQLRSHTPPLAHCDNAEVPNPFCSRGRPAPRGLLPLLHTRLP